MKSTITKFLIALFVICISVLAKAQTKISGIINTYAKVDSIIQQDKFIVDSISNFNIGDTILFIQMKGGVFTTLPSYNVKGTGKYEFVIIQNINTSTREVTLASNLLNFSDYDHKENIQIVKTPTYNYAQITSSNLTCRQWNGSKGGILAFMVDSVLEFSGNIDVTGKGFSGASFTQNSATCPTNNGSEYYPSTSVNNAGLKGEGITSNLFNLTRGIGPNINGGGGGYSKSAGGGGGGNFGRGGYGGYIDLVCTPIDSIDGGGKGGQILPDYFGYSRPEQVYRDRLFMGGGGGAGTGPVINSGTTGGHGGGIVFIITRKINGNGFKIISKGASVTDSSRFYAGSGGGGGGGFIVVSLDSLKNVTLDAGGGSGGRNNYCSGLGGGGGGGYIWISKPYIESLSINYSGGARGSIIGSGTTCPSGIDNSTSGGNGDSALNVNPVLNGFLFNTISASTTICYGDIPRTIIGSTPRGGDKNYKYQWQKRKFKTTTWQNISGANSRDYSTITPLYDSTEFRRIVKAYEPKFNDTVTDNGKIIIINVIPEIKTYAIKADTAICYGLPIVILRGETSTGGDGIIKYQWQTNNGTGWSSISGAIGVNCSQTSNTQTFIYRRITSSNICKKYSNEDTITVYPKLSGNQIVSDQTICYNYNTALLSGSAIISGGNNTYSYKWVKSENDTLNWQATGITTPTFNPGKLIVKTYYKRIVFSGLNNTCKDTSKSLSIAITPLIDHAKNVIQASHIKCWGDTPNLITGLVAEGGNNSYRYQWEKSNNLTIWDSITTSPSLQDFQYNSALTNTTYFRRIVRSGLNDCCLDTSVKITVTVQPAISNNYIKSAQEICKNQTPAGLTQNSGSVTGGDNTVYKYSWEKSLTLSGVFDSISSEHNSSFTPPALTQTTFYRRKIESGECKSYSDTIKINVLELITGNNLTGKNEVCFGLPADSIKSGTAINGGTPGIYRYSWQSSINGSSWTTIPTVTTENYFPGILNDSMYYRRIIKSGLNDCCISTSSSFYIQLNMLPIAILTVKDTSLCLGTELPVKVNITGNNPFSLLIHGQSGSSFNKSNLNIGNNYFSLVPSQSDSLYMFKVTDTKNCEASNLSGYIKARTIEIPVAKAGVDAEICDTLSFKLNATPSVGVGIWKSMDNNGVFANSSNPKTTVTYTSYGEHNLYWKETNEKCLDSAFIKLTFFQQPLKPVISNDITLSYTFVIDTLKAQQPNAGSGIWEAITPGISISDPNSLSPVFSNLIFGKNEIKYTVTNGNCPITSDTLVIIVDDVKRYIGFSPNGDKDNQYFEIDGVLNSVKRHLVIFNRWGTIVYSTENYDNKWQGTNNSGDPLPDDTYFYVLTLDYNREYKGYVVIKR